MRERNSSNVNTTGLVSLNGLGRDSRIERIDNEGRISEGGDGLWAYTVDGFCNGDFGCHILHEGTVRELLNAAKRIRPCRCLACDTGLADQKRIAAAKL